MQYLFQFIQLNAGAIINILGTIIIFIGIGPYPSGFGGSTTGNDGKTRSIAYINHPQLLIIGLVCLFFGFVFQLQLPKM